MKNHRDTTLALLLPTYNYAEGIVRIINSIGNISNVDQLVISDDSDNDCIARLITERGLENVVDYIRNIPSLGAVANWNRMIVEDNKCDYFILLHHDEVPITQNFFQIIRDELYENGMPDVLVMNYQLTKSTGKSIKKLIPQSLKSLVVNKFPLYLFRRNLIGPVSTLVIRRNCCSPFDERFKWFVDVEFYYRLATNNLKWSFSNKLDIRSIVDYAGSITNSNKPDLLKIKKIEVDYIANKFNLNKILLRIFVLYNLPETFLWFFARLFFYFNFLLRGRCRGSC